MFVTILKEMGLNIAPQAPPKDISLLGPTAGTGSKDWSGSMKECIELLADTPAAPALMAL